MPFASKIRKDILKILDGVILPSLRQQSITQVLAEPPFRLAEVVHWTESVSNLPDKDMESTVIFRRWPEEKLASLREPVLRFVYEGISYERIGITAEIAEKLKDVTGVIGVQVPAPGIICFGSHIPQADGTLRADVWNGVTKSLLIKTMPECLLVSLCERSPHVASATHNLEIRDTTLVQMCRIYIEELRYPDNQEGAQAQLCSLMHRLKRSLQNSHPVIGNSAWVEFETQKAASIHQKNQEMARYMVEYMQTHLHQDLTLQKLAAHFGVSQSQLNRIFRQSQGTTIMRHLTWIRIKTAKEMMRQTTERVSDIAALVGFTSVTSFCATFRKHTGYSPSQYRRLHHDKFDD